MQKKVEKIFFSLEEQIYDFIFLEDLEGDDDIWVDLNYDISSIFKDPL